MTDTATTRPMQVAGLIFAAVLGALLLTALLASMWLGIRGALAYGHLRDAQQVAESMRAELDDPARTSASIAELVVETGAARSLTSDAVWRAAEAVPWLGPQLAAVSTVAAAVDDVATTALTPLTQAASVFAFDELRVIDGRVDLTGIVGIQDAAAAAADSIRAASDSVRAIDSAALIGPVRESIESVRALLDEARGGTDALARATRLVPAMLGENEGRDYLLLFQNNAEWRSLGGNPGAMAVVHTDAGAMSLSTQDSTAGFPVYREPVLPLGPEVEGIYGVRPGRWMQNVTLVPDFAVAAQLAGEMWAREHGQSVDGVIALDPVTLSYLLRATGPVTLATGDVLTSDNAVSLLLNEVYLRYPIPADQNAFFALATAAVFDALSRGTADPAALVAALTQAGGEHRLLLWSAHDEDQRILAGTTLAGGLPRTDDEVSTFGVYLNDGTGSKMDFYMDADTAVGWDSCAIDATGRASGTATLTLTLTSHAPADPAGLSNYITGGGEYGVPPGTVRTTGYLYLPTGFELLDSTLTGDLGFGGGFHEGRQVLSFTVDTAPGASATATVVVRTKGPSAPVIAAQPTPTIRAGVGAGLVSRCGSA